VKRHCKTCKYLGKEFLHLKGHKECDEWYDCLYPLPWFILSEAVPMLTDAGIKCKAYKPRDI